jgi:anti-sigma B factor antagonist
VPLPMRTLDSGEWVVLQVAGEIDMASAPQLRQRVVALVTGGVSALVLDLSNIGFCDSTGLGVIVAAVKRLRTNGGDLRVVTNDERLLALFEITRLDQVFEVFPDIDAASATAPSAHSDESDH